MINDENKRIPFIKGLPYKLNETARISELLGRNYCKNYLNANKKILDFEEFRMLSHIISSPNLSQSDLSKLVFKGKAHVGKILNEMEQKGYINRILSTRNNIMVKCTVLTEKGKTLYWETDSVFRALADEISNGFSEEEIDTLIALLDKLKNRILETQQINF